MQRLEDRDEVVASGQLGIRGVPALERHSVIQTACRQKLPGSRDRGLVEIDAINRDLRVRTGDREARPAEPARDVGDTRRWICIQALMDCRHGRQPVLRKEVVEQRPGETRLAFVQVGAIVRIRNALAGPERGNDRVDRKRACDEQLSHRRHVVEAGLARDRRDRS